jgi:hypothetical protein
MGQEIGDRDPETRVPFRSTSFPLFIREIRVIRVICVQHVETVLPHGVPRASTPPTTGTRIPPMTRINGGVQKAISTRRLISKWIDRDEEGSC